LLIKAASGGGGVINFRQLCRFLEEDNTLSYSGSLLRQEAALRVGASTLHVVSKHLQLTGNTLRRRAAAYVKSLTQSRVHSTNLDDGNNKIMFLFLVV
jgi:hypothetical protein